MPRRLRTTETSPDSDATRSPGSSPAPSASDRGGPRSPDPDAACRATAAAAIRRDLLTLSGLPGERRIRAIYDVSEPLGLASAA